MDRRAVISLLIKVFPLYIIILIVWQYVGLSQYYHALLSKLLTSLYVAFDPGGPVKGIGVDEGKFLVKLLVAREKISLNITAEDVTSNTAMLLALYAASPVSNHLKKYALYFISSIVLLYLIHLITVSSTIQFAFITHPIIPKFYPPSPTALKVVPFYISFYLNFGMYLFILALWFPYIMSYMISMKRSNDLG